MAIPLQVQKTKKAAERVLEDTAERADKLYSEAKDWIPKNYPTLLAVSSAAVAVGLIAYFFGRASKRGTMSELAKHGAKLTDVVSNKTREFDFDRVLKFVKLWMVYRASV